MARGGNDRTAWYWDKEKLQTALDAAGGVIAELARQTDVPGTTLKHAVQTLGVEKRKGREGTITIEAQTDEALLHELREVKKKLKRYETGDLQAELALRRIENAVEGNRPRFKAHTFRPKAGGRTPQEMALLFSDLHASEVVTHSETRGINEYSWDVMLERIAVIQKSVISHKEHFGFETSVLNQWWLGDMLSGDIHDELAITNDRPTSEAMVDLAYDLVEWLLGFTPHFPLIRMRAVPGNHPRFALKPSAKQYHNNGDWLLYKMVEMLLKDHPQFQFDAPRSAFCVTTVADRWRVLLMHGDGIRSTMPGVPWGGISRRITTLESQFTQAREPLDYVALGHWHTRNVLDGIQAQTLMNGSVKGIDAYSLQRFGSGRPASQMLTTFHPKRGLTGMYPLDLQGRIPGSEGW
jgi:hypothetical protein